MGSPLAFLMNSGASLTPVLWICVMTIASAQCPAKGAAAVTNSNSRSGRLMLMARRDALGQGSDLVASGKRETALQLIAFAASHVCAPDRGQVGAPILTPACRLSRDLPHRVSYPMQWAPAID